jgi:peptide/nickel transport system substrate-binding protein
MWARVGVKATAVVEPFAALSARLQNLDSSAYLYGWSGPGLDAQNVLQPLVRTRTGGADGYANFGRISDAGVDQLVDTMKSEIEPARRVAMMRDALQRVRDEVLLIPLHHPMRPWAMKPRVDVVYRINDQPEARFMTVR